MPRFYFHVRDGETGYLDNEGTELSDLDEAIREAHKDIRYIYNEMLLPGALGSQVIDVVDEAGRTVATVAFADVLRLN
jgi:hypothetical protein